MPTARRSGPGDPRPWKQGLVLVLLIATFAAVVPAPSEAALVTVSPLLPFPILGTSAVHSAHGDFIFGGRSNQTYQASIIQYDPVTQAATTEPNSLPSGRQSTSAVYDGWRYAYIFGGAELVEINYCPTTTTCQPVIVPRALNDIIRFDTQTGAVLNMTAANLNDKLPDPAWGTSAVWDPAAGVAYIFGGFSFDFSAHTFNRLDTIIEFKPNATDSPTDPRVIDLSCSAQSSASGSACNPSPNPDYLPHPLQDAGAAVVGRTAYITGGLSSTCHNDNWQEVSCNSIDANASRTNATPTTDIVAFNLDTHIPTLSSATLPFGVQFAPAAAVGTHIFVLGGRLTNGTVSANIMDFDTSQQLALVYNLSLPAARYAVSAVVDGTHIRAFGGRDATAANSIGTRDVLDFQTAPTPPTAPQNLQSLADSNYVHLKWAVPTYNGGSPVQGFHVYRVDANGIRHNVTTTTELSTYDEAAVPGTKYTYQVTAFNTAGEGAPVAIQLTAELQPPSAPQDFVAYAGRGLVNLRWLAPAYVGGGGTVQYRIFRNNSATPLASTLAHEYNDTSVVNGVNYSYYVAAFTGAGQGPSTPTRSATPSGTIPNPPSGLNVVYGTTTASFQLSWTSTGAASYLVSWGTSQANLSSSQSVATASYTIAPVTKGVRYWITVQAADSQNRLSPPSDAATAAYVLPSGPVLNLTGLTAIGVVQVDWAPPATQGGALTVFYSVTRTGLTAGDSNAAARQLLVPDSFYTGTSWSDSNATTPGDFYQYTVQPFSTTSSGTPLAGTSQNVTVYVPTAAIRPPTAIVFVVNNTFNPQRFQRVTFDASQSHDPTGLVTKYDFSFGDGTSTGWQVTPTATTQYLSNGTYNVTVDVMNDRGIESIRPAILQIVVGPEQIANETTSVTGLGDHNGTHTNGTTTKAGSLIPAPEAPLVLVAIAAVALLAAARSRGGPPPRRRS
ncbi:MAG: fibronectin type III domain-containing protein [Thermoplasmatota archaeon]